MKRIVVFLAMALMAFSVAQAESEQDSTFVFGPADTETAAPELTPSPTPASTPIPADSGDSGFDFSQVDNPLATPVAVNPIDMPTPTPTPAPNYAYETYKNDSMGISFDIPYTWLLNPATNQETTIQFVEPKSERMEVDGYQTRLTVEKFSAGLSQTASDARTRLLLLLFGHLQRRHEGLQHARPSGRRRARQGSVSGSPDRPERVVFLL